MTYAIEVERISVRLRTLSGEDVAATCFIHPVGHADYRPESIGDRLNSSDTWFLPCEIEGESHLVRLSSIAYVELAEAPPELEMMEAVGAVRAPVKLRLKSGDSLEGELVYEAERGEERVSDMLNRHTERFLLLTEGDTTYFVQCEAIDRVRV